MTLPGLTWPGWAGWAVLIGVLHKTNSGVAEHARLKDHVASMEGGLEAKIHEGGKQCLFFFISLSHPHGVGFPGGACGFCRLWKFLAVVSVCPVVECPAVLCCAVLACPVGVVAGGGSLSAAPR